MADAPRCGCTWRLSGEQAWKVVSVLSLIVTDTGLSMSMSKLFNDTPFKFPLYLTMMTMFLSFCLAGLVLNTEVEGRTLPRLKRLGLHWRNVLKICGQALAFALNESLFNLSLTYTSLTMSMVVRATIPLLVIVMVAILQRRVRSAAVWIAVLGSVLGMAMTLYKNPQFHLVGVLLAAGSAFTAALFIVLSEYIMMDVDLDALNMLFYAALPTSVFILPFFIALEFVSVVSYVQSYFWMNIFILCAMGILAFLFSLSQYQVVRLTNGVYASVVENIRVVLVVILSAIIFYDSETRLSLLNQIGVVITLLCFGYITFLDSSGTEFYQFPGTDVVSKLIGKLRGKNTFGILREKNVIPLEERRYSLTDEDDEDDEDNIIQVM